MRATNDFTLCFPLADNFLQGPMLVYEKLLKYTGCPILQQLVIHQHGPLQEVVDKRETENAVICGPLACQHMLRA